MSLATYTTEYKDHKITITWEPDTDMGPPWEEHEGHGPVSDWSSRDKKKPGERILNCDGSSYRFYDFAEAMKIAKRDQWGLNDEDLKTLAVKLGHAPSPGEITAEAVERDFHQLKGWCDDEWCWVMYEVTVIGPGGEIEYPEKYLGGIDSPSIDYFNKECAQQVSEWLDERERIAAQYIIDPTTA